MRQKVLLIFIPGLAILAIVAILLSPTRPPINNPKILTPTPTTILPVETLQTDESPIPTLPPPLAEEEFPTEAVDYPSDWSTELYYPVPFQLVDAGSTILPGGRKVWAAKLRYQGDPKSAANVLSSFLHIQGWEVQREELDAGGVLLTIGKNGKKNSGTIIVDPDTDSPGNTKILAAVFL